MGHDISKYSKSLEYRGIWDKSVKQPIRWVMDEPGYGRSPVVCVDSSGLFWAAWISWTEPGECVRISWREPGAEWTTPVACSVVSRQVTGLALAPWDDGVLVAWIDGEDPEHDGLKMRSFDPGGGTEPRLVVPHRRGPAHPALDAQGSRYALAWTVRSLEGRRLFACFGQDPAKTDEVQEISESGGFNLRPAVLDIEGDSLGVITWEAAHRNVTRILARQFDTDGDLSRTIEICRHTSGICAQPAVCRAADRGAWVAWQSDRDPEGEVGLVRWLEVAHLDADGVVRQPIEPMRDVERSAKGEDQGFESPSITTLEDGRLVVIGRGSQSVRRQDLGSAGWSKRAHLDEQGWLCRGRRFSAHSTGEDLLIAGRERDEVVVRWLPAGDDVGDGDIGLEPLERSQTIIPPPPRDSERRYIIAGQRVLFGDLHQHTMLSDGTGTLEETYHRARYRYRDDIVSVADHESFLGKRTTPGEWAETCRAADELYQPGLFVVLHAFEWTGKMYPGPGHKVVYLPAHGGPVLSREDDDTMTPKGLLSECRRLGALAFPHHVGWTGANMADHDSKVQTCFEIVSCHGAYERPELGMIGTRGDDKPGQFVAEALDSGLRFGIVGGSDGHGLNWHHGVCRVQDSHRTGLTGIFSREVSREGVLEALRRRRCYATSGAKIGMWFEIDGRPMGEELVSGGPVPFRVVVAGTDSIEKLSLVSNKGREIELDASGLEADVRGSLQAPPAGGWCYYYVRILQRNGEIAWSSPIWLDAPDTA